MNDQELRMAVECQLLLAGNREGLYADALKKFADLIRADERNRAMRENAYVLAEREACAAKAEQVGQHKNHIGIAAAIRARSNT